MTKNLFSPLLLLLCLAPNLSNSFLETFQDSVNGLKHYAGEILPYLQQGVKMVRRAEDFVDSAIGEDCTYECSKGEKFESIPRSGHVKTSNGCGSYDFLFDDSEERYATA